tara:strand:- start:121 stop:927 length:807 start_codon:yes stop_codon:yes gene_type:complete
MSSFNFGSIERVKSGFITGKFEFVYSDDFPVKKGIPYSIFYTTDKRERFVIDFGRTWQEIFVGNPKKHYTTFQSYTTAKGGEIEREKYVRPSRPVITEDMRKKGIIKRYFVSYHFDNETNLFEISKKDYSKKLVFYKKASLDWKLTGNKQEVKEHNEEQLEMGEDILRGMRYLLNPLEFYVEEITEEQILNKKLENLLHNPHTYEHQSDAMNVANALGLSGTHTMPDGTIMPGATHQEYLDALRRNEEITTSSGTTISTQNLRRNSGY